MTSVAHFPAKGMIKTVVVCEVKLDDKCTIKHPGHHNFSSLAEYNACDGQQATIVAFSPPNEQGVSSVDLRLDTGPCIGQIVRDVDTANLHFLGTFQRVHEEALDYPL